MDRTKDSDKKIGLLILVLTAMGVGFLIVYFNQSGTYIQYRDVAYMLKMVGTYGLLVVGLYVGLYFISGKKIANQIGGGLAILLILAYIVGRLLH